MSLRGLINTTLQAATDTVAMVGHAASAGKTITKIADDKAQRFAELVELKDEATYKLTKADLEAKLKAMGVTDKDKK